MKKSNKILNFLLVLSLIFIFSCEDRSDLTAPAKPSTGDADFSRFMTIGNSLTAGYQNSALYEDAQEYSFGKQIADAVGVSFVQPLVSEPGLSTSGGRMELASLAPDIVFNSGMGEFMNLTYQNNFNNLGVPGAMLNDFFTALDANSCTTAQHPVNTPNPFFDGVLLGKGTQFTQLKNYNTSFFTLWLGNNDVLGYATSGGYFEGLPLPEMMITDQITFADTYNDIVDSIATLSAKGVFANIPPVTAIPYFTTVGRSIADKVINDTLGIENLYYQKSGETVASGIVSINELLTNEVLFTLAGSSAAGLLGDTTGLYYTMNDITPPEGIVLSAPFGVHPYNPWPDKYVLDEVEMLNVQNAIEAYNTTIYNAISEYPEKFALADMYTFFSNIAENGHSANGLTLTCDYITGGLFSLDGVHPTSQGYAVVANEFIRVINENFDAEIPSIDVSRVPGSIELTK